MGVILIILGFLLLIVSGFMLRHTSTVLQTYRNYVIGLVAGFSGILASLICFILALIGVYF